MSRIVANRHLIVLVVLAFLVFTASVALAASPPTASATTTGTIILSATGLPPAPVVAWTGAHLVQHAASAAPNPTTPNAVASGATVPTTTCGASPPVTIVRQGQTAAIVDGNTAARGDPMVVKGLSPGMKITDLSGTRT